jgi:hypothetical protein
MTAEKACCFWGPGRTGEAVAQENGRNCQVSVLGTYLPGSESSSRSPSLCDHESGNPVHLPELSCQGPQPKSFYNAHYFPHYPRKASSQACPAIPIPKVCLF